MNTSYCIFKIKTNFTFFCGTGYRRCTFMWCTTQWNMSFACKVGSSPIHPAPGNQLQRKSVKSFQGDGPSKDLTSGIIVQYSLIQIVLLIQSGVESIAMQNLCKIHSIRKVSSGVCTLLPYVSCN
jgi:hypothetical protein